MNALTLSAIRRRNSIVILSGFNLEARYSAPSTTICSAIRRVATCAISAISAITPSAVCTASCAAAGAVCYTAALTGHDLAAGISGALCAVGIFFISPALDASKAKKGGAK